MIFSTVRPSHQVGETGSTTMLFTYPRVIPAVPEEKITRHRRVGSEQLRIRPAVASFCFFFAARRDGVAIAIDHQRLSNDGNAEELPVRFGSDDARAPSASSRSFIRRPCSTVRERKRGILANTANPAARSIPLAYLRSAPQFRTYGLNNDAASRWQ
jgi:hypothetical protein